MKTKAVSYSKMLEDIRDRFEEWHEEGYSYLPFVAHLLYQEKEKNFYLEERIEELEKRLRK